MTAELVRLRVVTAFSIHRVGDIVERLPSVAKQMLAARWYGRKLVEPVPDPPRSPEIPDHDSLAKHEIRQSVDAGHHYGRRYKQRNR